MNQQMDRAHPEDKLATINDTKATILDLPDALRVSAIFPIIYPTKPRS